MNKELIRVADSNLSALIKKKRIQKGWSQQTLAGKAHVSISSLSKAENNHVSPNSFAVFKIMKALDIPRNQIFDFKAFWRKIRCLRFIYNIKQQDMAKKCGMLQTVLGKAELGKAEAKDYITIAASVFNMTPDEVIHTTID